MRELVRTINKVGYQIRHEMVDGAEYGIEDQDGPILMKSAYTPDGHYIGRSIEAHWLITKRGIKPELARPDANVCSIGFCEANQKWYGWSHRAIAGFGLGDKLFDAEWSEATEETPFIDHGSKPIESLEEARQAAINFAQYVS